MKKIIIVVTVILFLGGVVWAEENYSDKPIIDEQFKKIELDIKRVTTECIKKEKNAIKRMKCGEELKENYKKQGKLRGTDEYCKKHYGGLTFSELRKVWKDLKQQRRKARIDPFDSVPGEVTEGKLMVEEFWVESRLAGMQKANTNKIEKSLNYKNLTKTGK